MNNTSICSFCILDHSFCICPSVDEFFMDCENLPRVPAPSKLYIMLQAASWLTMMVCLLVGAQGCGKPGPQGAQGPSGVSVTGPRGQQGIPGTNGVDASPFYPIQLCSSCTAHYPDIFPEVAFCYQGNLYGTYSANGGFSSSLPVGTYNSNGINCSCTVTISANCQVQG